MNLAVVEDDPLVLRSLIAALEVLGHQCNGFELWSEAKRFIESGNVDVLFTDLHMPLVSGYEIVDDVRRSELPIRVVAVSGEVGNELDQRLTSAGFDASLSKPYSLQELIGVLNSVMA